MVAATPLSPHILIQKLHFSCLFLLLLLALSPLTIRAESFHNLSIEDGLSQSIVFNITQDKTGYMWFATQDGLNRFDGSTFKVFKTDTDKTNAIADNYIYPLAYDDDNNLWLGTRSAGINKLALDKYWFSHYSPANSALTSNRITALHANGNRVWLGTYQGQLHYFDKSNNKVSEVLLQTQKPIYSLLIDSHLQLWVGTHGDGVYLYDLASGQQSHFVSGTTSSMGLSHNSIFTIHEDNNKQVWLGSQGGGLFRYDQQQKVFRNWRHDANNNTSLSHDQVRVIFSDRQNRLWVGTRGGGLNLYQPNSDSFSHFKHDIGDKYSLAHNRIYSIFEDNNSMLWIGTANGISKLDPLSLVFKNLKAPKDLNSKDIWSLYQDTNEHLWVGSWGGGVNSFDGDLNANDAQNRINTLLNNNAIKAMLEDEQKRLWIGTWGGGLELIDVNQNSTIHFVADDTDIHSLADNNVLSLLIDDKQQLWVGTDGGGLNRFNQQQQSFSHKDNSAHLLLNIPAQKINSLFQDKDRNYWVGTDGYGLYRYNRAQRTLVQYTKGEPGKYHISHNTVRTIYEDKQGYIWVGTSNGLNRITQTTGETHHFGVEQGLANQVVYAIEADQQDNLWLSTNKGISRFNPNVGLFTNFDRTDGLVGNEYNAGASVALKDGRLAFGGTNGVTTFTPKLLKVNNSAGGISVTNVLLDQKPLHQHSHANLSLYASLPEQQQSIELTHQVNRLSLSFAHLRYVKNMGSEFSYRLIGFDHTWQYHLGKSLTVDYTNLDPGQYQLQVKAIQHGMTNNTDRLYININVVPAPWNTWWAYVGYVALVLAIIYLLIRMRIYRVEQQRRQLAIQVEQRTEEIAEQRKVIEHQAHELQLTLDEKNRLFTNASHELRTPLSLIIAPIQRLLNEEQDSAKKRHLEIILRNGKRLKSMVNRVLTLSHIESFKDKTNERINVSHIARKTADQFNSAYQSHSVEFHSNIEDNLYIDAHEHGIETILINLLGNSFKFTKQGHISLEVGKDEHDKIVITVTDSGKGIAKAQQQHIFEPFNRGDDSDQTSEGSGIGLAIVGELAKQFNATIELESEINSGCCFRLTFDQAATIDNPLPPQYATNPAVSAQSLPVLEYTDNLDRDYVTDATKKTLLIVEDNLELNEFLRADFRNDYNVLVANNGQQGLLLAQQELPDLIISDIMMPKLNGIDMLNKINAHQLTCHIPVILLTAKNDKRTRLTGFKSQAIDFIDKPFDLQELQLKVENWITWAEKMAQRDVSSKPSRQQILLPQDYELLSKLDGLLEQHFAEHNLDAEFIAREMAMSSRQLQRKLKAITDQSPIEYLRNFRLAKSQPLLIEGMQVNLVAHQVGFSTSSYFAKAFKNKFSVTPKTYQQKNL